MKTLMTSLILFLIGIIVYAQPSDGQLNAKIKSNHSSATSVELIGSGLTEKSYDDGAYRTFYRRSYRIKSPTEHTGITRVYSGSIQYVRSGGSYIFDKFLIGDTWYLGVPNPDQNEIIIILKADLKKYISTYHYNKIVGDISEITFPSDPEYRWHTLSSVSFKTKVTYSEKISNTKLQKAEHTYVVRLYADEFKGPWNGFQSREEDKERKQISLEEYTREELNNMKTLDMIDAENQAANVIASLPNVGDVESFESSEQLFYFIHDIILTKTADEIHAYFYKVISDECYQENSTVLFNNSTKKWMDELLENLDAYKIAYCQYPTVKAKQSSMIQFYDRANTRMLRMTASTSDNTWKLTLISFYPASASEQEELKNMEDNCQEKPDLAVREVKSYEVGDKVIGIFSNGEFNSTIDKLDPYNKNRYFIKLDGDGSGKGYWMEETHLKPGSNTSSSDSDIENEETKSTESAFKIDETVYVKTSKGKMKATIKELTSEKAYVDFKNPLYDDMWVNISNVSREK